MEAPYSELEYLAAATGGKWGFTYPMVSGQGLTASLLTVDLPTYMARVWTLNILAPRYQSGINVALANGEPVENAVSLTGMFVRLDYGVGDAMESVEFDYCARGMTVQFHASVIRAYLRLPFIVVGQPAPLLGGFLAPQSRGNVAADVMPCCTWTTTGLVLVGVGVQTFVWAPRRARAYRLIPASSGDLGACPIAEQVAADQSTVAVDYDGTDFDGAATSGVIEKRTAWAPMVPGAVGVRLTSQLAAPANYRVQFLLDIG